MTPSRKRPREIAKQRNLPAGSITQPRSRRRGKDVLGVAKPRDDRRDDEVGQVLDNLRRIVRVLYGHSHRLELLAGLTSAQAWLITTLSKLQPAEVSVLARAMHLRPSAVDRIVGRLEERGLVVGNRSLNDHVKAKVTLTNVGMKLFERIPANPQELLLKGLSEIPRGRLRAVSEGVESLARILDAKEMAPLLFFALVANLPADESDYSHRVARLSTERKMRNGGIRRR